MNPPVIAQVPMRARTGGSPDLARYGLARAQSPEPKLITANKTKLLAKLTNIEHMQHPVHYFLICPIYELSIDGVNGTTIVLECQSKRGLRASTMVTTALRLN
jgi:hypothetical protein